LIGYIVQPICMKEGAITDRIMELAEKWLDGSITEPEKAEFALWYNQFNDEVAVVPVQPAVLQTEMLEEILARMHAEKRQQSPVVIRPAKHWMRYAALVAGLFLVSATGYFLLHKKSTGPVTPLTNKSPCIQDIAPGTQKAVLTLADGSSIILDSAVNGPLTHQGNSVVNKKKDGELEYKSAIPDKSGQAGNRQSATTFNTLSTPRGGQYQLVLSDGSKVWLNAASSITYPTAFTGNERKVQITGEAYFEVTHNSKMPFVVEKGSMTVEVLGTHFNINAYEDESAIQTTLLQGSVKVGSRQWAAGSGEKAEGRGQRVEKKEQSIILKPGEQTSLSQTSQLSQPIPVQTDEVMAWKNGLFQFHNAGLAAVLRQISRWYDVDIRYAGEMPVREFEGKIQRNLTLLQVLKILEKNQVHLTLEGKTIIVKNK